MNTIVTKTEKMIGKIKSRKINFLNILNLSLANIDTNNPKKNDDGNIVVTLGLTECADFLGLEYSHKRNLKVVIDRILKDGISESILTLKNTEEESNVKVFLVGYKTSTKTDTIKLEINPYFLSYIATTYVKNDEMKFNRYIRYDFNMLRGCKSTYTVALYELLNLYSYKEGKHLYDITFDALKEFLDITHRNVAVKKSNNQIKPKANGEKRKRKLTKETYMDYKEFKHSILSPALKYINENTDLSVSIVKEDRCKKTYSIDGEEKEVYSADKIYFKIVKKEEMKIKDGYLYATAKKLKVSEDALSAKLKEISKTLRKYSVYATEENICALFALCGDINLVIYALIDAATRKNIDNIIGYAHSIILEKIKENDVDGYKGRMKIRVLQIKKKINNESGYVLSYEEKEEDTLVKVYDVYQYHSCRVSKNDVENMKNALSKHNSKKIEKYILLSSYLLSLKGRLLYGFGFVDMMLERNAFENKKKEDIKNVADFLNKKEIEGLRSIFN